MSAGPSASDAGARMRLDRRVALATGMSRNEVRERIRRGEVSVDSVAVRDPATAVDGRAAVTLQGQQLSAPTARYLMLHKPAGVVCANRDRAHRTVFDLLQLSNPAGLHVAGRLDLDATGLVLITDDGDWSHRLTSPRHEFAKTYRVELAEPLTVDARRVLEAGVTLKGEARPCAPAGVEPLGERTILLTLTEGKYHQVKRMLAAVGNHVTALHRERIGAIVLDLQLAPGQSRPLSQAEWASVQPGS